MGYNVYSLRGGGGGSYRQKSDVDEFEEAAMMAKEGIKMAKEGVEMICEISEEMADQFGFRERRGGGRGGNRGGGGSSGGRGGYGSREGYRERGGYGERDEWDDEEMMQERRRRDRMGRFM